MIPFAKFLLVPFQSFAKWKFAKVSTSILWDKKIVKHSSHQYNYLYNTHDSNAFISLTLKMKKWNEI
jgi:hypothetical protein